MENTKETLTIGIGGAAGDGVKKAGVKIAAYLRDQGYQVYLSFDYPSLIRGGHNFARLTAGKDKVWCDQHKLDLLIVSNEESIELHKEDLKDEAKVVKDVPLSQIAENPAIVLGDLDLEIGEPLGELFDGNTAFAEGLMAAGLDFYFAYPMTPSTSILHYLAGKQTKEGLRVIQPENEIAVINMALGASYAGKRVALGSASGGFALMQEAFSFAGIAELPLVVAVSQRQAPGTGAPTYSSQSDLRFVIHAGHGEFSRVVIAPGDPEESFKAGVEALNLSQKFRIPTVVLLDKILSENMTTVNIERLNPPTGGGKMERSENQKIPGTPGEIVKATSYEHDEEGFTVDKAEDVKRMIEKRFQKEEELKKEMQNKETVKIYGSPESEEAVVFWGSTKGPVLEACAGIERPLKLVQVLWVEPFDSERILKELSGLKKIICVEANHNGQLSGLIREKTGIEIAEKILKYDSRPFDPRELAEEIKRKI